MSPVSSISSACLRARLRESATMGVEQNRPICTPGVQNLALVEATARSQVTTSSFAAAGPLAGAEDWAFIGVGFREPRPSPFYLAQRAGGASYRGTGRVPAR